MHVRWIIVLQKHNYIAIWKLELRGEDSKPNFMYEKDVPVFVCFKWHQTGRETTNNDN